MKQKQELADGFFEWLFTAGAMQPTDRFIFTMKKVGRYKRDVVLTPKGPGQRRTFRVKVTPK